MWKEVLMRVDVPAAVLAVATVILAIITYFHMRHAKSLVDKIEHIAKMIAEQNERMMGPYLEVRRMGGFSYDGVQGVLRIPMMMTNLGSWLCHVKNVECVCSVSSRSEKLRISISRLEEKIINADNPVPFEAVFGIPDLGGVVDPSKVDVHVEMEVAGVDGVYKKGMYKARL